LSLAWSAALIGLMATGSLSPARIGTMTWGPGHDIWSAAIAISQINFGLSGKLGYREIDQAIANELIASKNTWDSMDDTTRGLLKDPSAVSRGLRAAAAVTKDGISVPTVREGYLTDWCEDLGYADFYNLAFRIFGFNAFSTHWLYIGILTLSCLLFVIAYFRDNLAVGTLTLSITALFLVTSSSIFSESMPAFAANRFLSTLAAIPLLHVIHAALRRCPFGRPEVLVLLAQAGLLAFAITLRSSADWCIVAFIVSVLAVAFVRRFSNPVHRPAPIGMRRFVWRLTSIPYVRRLGITGLLVLAVTASVGVIRNSQFDEVYFRDDNLPHHLFWHSAFLGLTLHPEWAAYRPIPEISASGDGAAFLVFEYRMRELGQPHVSDRGYYRIRVSEPMIRDEYLRFIVNNPRFVFDLFTYYKPRIARDLLVMLTGSIGGVSRLLAGISLVLVTTLFAWPREPLTSRAELATSFGIVWLCSLLPVLWAYPAPHVFADQLWSTLFVLLAIVGLLGARIVQAIIPSDDKAVSVQTPAPSYADERP
jgi:hypothetical protein